MTRQYFIDVKSTSKERRMNSSSGSPIDEVVVARNCVNATAGVDVWLLAEPSARTSGEDDGRCSPPTQMYPSWKGGCHQTEFCNCQLSGFHVR